MSVVIAQLHRANHGGNFRGYGLRGDAGLLSPFLGVDHYWMSAPTFPLHQHAGMSAVSYLFLDSETGMNNRDSIGTHNLIQPGGLHWTTAGRGVAHEEVPAERGKTVHGLQFFVALTPSKRDIAPFPLILESQDVPIVQLPGARIRVPLGSYGQKRSPLAPPTEVTLLDISLEEGAELTVPVPEGHLLFAMPIFGTVEVQDQRFNSEDLKLPVLPAQDAPRDIALRAPLGSVKVVIFSALPLSLI
ncbi:pirin family protein [Agrobacterium tumefaciens]|uniref:pirin family protein n=1 Tax=Agrobacterium tumefaciens TaxID=358 RepID=UPI0021D1EF06|nr:pirin family protein [Agrobacterium tumefaciens]UXS01918.1 pirin family protein [Agrobacterium tumefaciens]